MADLEGVPQWKRDLIRRRRALHHQSQTAVRRGCGHADMLLQSPGSIDLSADPTDCSEDGSATERSTPLRDTDNYTDSGEELTYGPGIVKKLKSRYLSLTLREANKTRPSIHGLRRATSLEHVLEDEKPTPPPRKYQPTAPTSTRQTRYRQPTRTPDAVRRARSVDALARCDSRSEPEDILSPVERESPISKEPSQPPPLLSPTLRPKRPPPLLKDTERPPPDLVKQALKIFEGQPGKKLRTPSTGQVADKVKSFSETQKQTKKTNCAKLPRPAVPPRGALLTSSPEHKHIPVATQTTPSLYSRPPPSPKKFASHKDDRERSLSPVYVNRHPVILAPADTSPVKVSSHNDFHIIKGLKPLDLKSPESSPRNSMLKSPDLLSPRETCHRQRNGVDENTAKDPYIRTSTPDPEILTQPAAAEISLIAPTSPHNRNPSERIKKYSSSDDDSVFEDEEKPPKTKVVDKSSLEKISKAGTTSQFSFSSVNGVNGNAKKSYLPSAKKQYSNSNSLNNKSEGVFLHNSKSNSIGSNSVSNSKSKVPDLIQMSNVKNAATLASQAMTVADVKLIKPVVSVSVFPGCGSSSGNISDNSAVGEQCISAPVPSEIVQTCPTLPSKELRVVPDARRVKDIESSPALVDYNPPSPAPPPHGPKQNLSLSLSLTSREIEKNLINTSKTLAADPPSNDFTTRNSLEQPVKKVTVNMLEGPDKTKAAKGNLTENEGGGDGDVSSNGVVSSSTTTSVSVVQNNSDINIVICKETNSVVTNENNVSGGGASKLSGGRKPQWHQQESTTMLFDFSKRKGVPDYIENDGLIRRREKPKIGVGVIAIDGLSGESCTDGNSDSGDEEWSRRPPSPCDVAFENDNIVINGRSNISAGKPRTRHLKIQFDESLTTTFEYPSEASLGEEHFAGTNSSSSPSSPIATGGPLSSYTPSKVSLQSESFQLGVTRSHSQTSEKNGNLLPSNEGSLNNTINSPSKSTSDTSNHDRQNAEEPYLKPCQEDQSHNWSHETHIGAGDLLF